MKPTWIVGIIVIAVIIILGLAAYTMMPLTVTTHEPYEGWELKGELFDIENYEGLASVFISGHIDFIGGDYNIPQVTPYPTEYWINIWYKEDGSNTWRIISGVEDNTNIGMAIPNDILFHDFNFIKHPALIDLSSDPEPLHPTFSLEWAENNFLVELNGELRVDVRVQMIHPEITLYDEHTLGSDYASISPTDTNDGEDDGIPGFEMFALITAIGIALIILRKRG